MSLLPTRLTLKATLGLRIEKPLVGIEFPSSRKRDFKIGNLRTDRQEWGILWKAFMARIDKVSISILEVLSKLPFCKNLVMGSNT